MKSTMQIHAIAGELVLACEHDGLTVLRAAIRALEMCDFDHEAETLTKMFAAHNEAEAKGLAPRFTLAWAPADEDARFVPAEVGDYGLFSDIDDDDRDDDEDDDGDGDDYTFPDDHPLFGANDPAKLPEDDPRYIPF